MTDEVRKMSQKVLFIKMLLVHYTTQSLPEIIVSCKEDVPLKCPDVDIDSMDFLSVTWYKITNKGKSGIIRRVKGEEATQNYNFSRSARFGEKHSLFLHSVTPEDSGTYECFISANVGGQNQYLKVALTVNVCVTEMTPMNTTHSGLPCHQQVEDLPFMWSILGYVAVGLTKIILSLISIWAGHLRTTSYSQGRPGLEGRREYRSGYSSCSYQVFKTTAANVAKLTIQPVWRLQWDQST